MSETQQWCLTSAATRVLGHNTIPVYTVLVVVVIQEKSAEHVFLIERIAKDEIFSGKLSTC